MIKYFSILFFIATFSSTIVLTSNENSVSETKKRKTATLNSVETKKFKCEEDAEFQSFPLLKLPHELLCKCVEYMKTIKKKPRVPHFIKTWDVMLRAIEWIAVYGQINLTDEKVKAEARLTFKSQKKTQPIPVLAWMNQNETHGALYRFLNKTNETSFTIKTIYDGKTVAPKASLELPEYEQLACLDFYQNKLIATHCKPFFDSLLHFFSKNKNAPEPERADLILRNSDKEVEKFFDTLWQKVILKNDETIILKKIDIDCKRNFYFFHEKNSQTIVIREIKKEPTQSIRSVFLSVNYAKFNTTMLKPPYNTDQNPIELLKLAPTEDELIAEATQIDPIKAASMKIPLAIDANHLQFVDRFFKSIGVAKELSKQIETIE